MKERAARSENPGRGVSTIMKRNSQKMSKALLLWLTIIEFMLTCGLYSSVRAQTVRIAVGTASVASLPTWVAADGGYFAREGLHPELIYIRGGPQTLSALLGGDVHFAQVYSGPIVSARLTGADTTIVAGLINQPLFSIVTASGINKPEDLRGKKVGITTFGSATDVALRLALKKWGLKPESEVNILQMRGVPEILPALASGSIHGGVLSPPTNMMAIKAGFKELSYLPQLGVSFQHTCLATTRRYLDRNRGAALKALRAYGTAIERIKADKPFAKKVLSKHMQTTDADVLEYSYNAANPIFKTPPYPTLEGIRATLDFLAEKEPKAKQVQAKDFADLSLLEELEKTGAADK
jgi:NitT/TauT family transport system substrate-binding protein